MLKRKSTRTSSVKAAAPEVKRRRGRPAKAEVEEPKRRRGRPAKAEAPVAKRRGRPAKAEAPAKKAVATAINTHLVVRSTQRIVGEPSIAKGCVKVAGMTLPLSVVTAVINDTVFYNHYSDLGAITSISEKNGLTAYVLEGGVLRFCFEVKDEDVVSPYTQDNDDIWNADAVEVFISPDGDLKNYKELEVSPFGVRFYGAVFNKDGESPALEKQTPPFSASAELTGTGYRAEIGLPVSALAGFDEKKMKFNAFRLDKKADGRQLLYALSPTFCRKFHRPKYFLSPERG